MDPEHVQLGDIQQTDGRGNRRLDGAGATSELPGDRLISVRATAGVRLFLRRSRPTALSSGTGDVVVGNYVPVCPSPHSLEATEHPRIMAEAILREYSKWTAHILVNATPIVVSLDPGDLIGVPLVASRLSYLGLYLIVDPGGPLYNRALSVVGARGSAGLIELGPSPDFQLKDSQFETPMQEAFWHS